MFVPTWPDKKTELLEQFFAEGCSTSVISYRLGEQGYRATKNAVIGKLHRLGLTGTPKPTKDKPAPQRIKNAVISPARPVPKLRRKVMVPVHNGNGATMVATTKAVLFTELKEDDCKSIIGPVIRGHPSYCCGKMRIWKIVDDKRVRSPWCEEHDKLYTTEPRKR